ncbi:MAG: RHS repeat-associated core domain-containing protein, partial [Clostridiales bacterium]
NPLKTKNITKNGNVFSYTGYQYDESTGLMYAQFRYYMPEIGRFISEDPINDGVNWYVYCDNNPILLVDPLRLCSEFDVIGGESPAYPDYIIKGMRNSKDEYRSLDLYENTEMYRKVLNTYQAAKMQALVFHGEEGGDMLLHHLENNEQTYVVDFAKMNLESSSSAKKKEDINKTIEAAEKMCIVDNDEILAISKKEDQNGSIEKDDSFNWNVAIHNYRTYTYFSVIKNGDSYTMTIEYNLRDFYDWNKYDTRKVGLVSPSDMWYTNAYGWARTSEVIGVETINVTWKEGQNLGTGAKVY